MGLKKNLHGADWPILLHFPPSQFYQRETKYRSKFLFPGPFTSLLHQWRHALHCPFPTLTWKCFLCVLSKLPFLNPMSLLSLQSLNDGTKERNCRVSDPLHKEIFLSLAKPWLERLLFLFLELQSISTSSSNEWSYLTAAGKSQQTWLASGLRSEWSLCSAFC